VLIAAFSNERADFSAKRRMRPAGAVSAARDSLNAFILRFAGG
jgi:hypothetical protein